jgi:isocitrate lyase
MNTLPDKVDQFVKAQMLHDRKQNEERAKMTPAERAATPRRDYFKPCVADADAGFGGITSVMKLTKLMIEAGAAGMHLEDQKPGVKKCGHLGGKVLVSVREHLTRLQAARLQSDIMGCDIVIVARTDSLDASFIDNNIDPIDHPWIMGCVDPNDPSKTSTFVDAGLASIQKNLTGNAKQDALKFWNANAKKMSLQQAQAYAKKNGFGFFYDCEANRTDEGYYKLKRGDIDYPVARAIAFADYADLIWPETHSPDLAQAKEFSDKVHAAKPNAMLGYNNSPSFNWDLHFKNNADLEAFIPTMGKLGFVWQFVTLAGFHMDALMSEVFSRNFAQKGMLAYVEYIQRKEKEEKVDQLLHQKWSGANLKDREVQLASAGKASSIANDASGESTEKQFAQTKL